MSGTCSHFGKRTKSFQRKPDAQAYLNGLTADLQRGEYVDPRKSAETFGSVAEQWFATKQHRKPKTVAGYRSLLDTVVFGAIVHRTTLR